MEHRLVMQYEDTLEIVLPDGQEVSIDLSHIDDSALPELDILLPQEMVANCYRGELEPATPDKDSPHTLSVCQIIIPIETKGNT